jgi:hypothetical protein
LHLPDQSDLNEWKLRFAILKEILAKLGLSGLRFGKEKNTNSNLRTTQAKNNNNNDAEKNLTNNNKNNLTLFNGPLANNKKRWHKSSL